MKSFRAQCADMFIVIDAESGVEAEELLRSIFGDLSGRPVIITEYQYDHFFAVSAEGDVMYYNADTLEDAKKKFASNPAYAEIPSEMLSWTELRLNEIPVDVIIS